MMLSQTPKLTVMVLISDFFGATHLMSEVVRRFISHSGEVGIWAASHWVANLALWTCAALLALRHAPKILRFAATIIDEANDFLETWGSAIFGACIAPLIWLLGRASRALAHALKGLRKWQFTKGARSIRQFPKSPVQTKRRKPVRGQKESAPRRRQSQPKAVDRSVDKANLSGASPPSGT